MFKYLKKHIKHQILIRLHIGLWVLFGVYSVYDTLWNCTEWEILPYLFIIWIFFFVSFYISYGYISPQFFVQRKYLKASLGLVVVLIILNFAYTELQYLIPTNICNNQNVTHDKEGRLYYWFNIIINLKTTSVIILFAFGLYYLEHSKSEELKQKLVHIDYLKNQISPHYLLNALNNLMFTALEEPENVKTEIEELSDWLVFSLYKIDKDFIKFEEEINHIQLYFKRIEQYKEATCDFRIFADFDKQVLEIKEFNIPPLILFNLAENAVKYSQVINKPNGFVHFDCMIKEDKCIIICKNSIDKNYTSGKKENGIGIENIKQRLFMYYENSYSFTSTKIDDVFTVEIKLPL
ncbi:MAG: sensor histidine kinase [Flavobacteriales bacterium]